MIIHNENDIENLVSNFESLQSLPTLTIVEFQLLLFLVFIHSDKKVLDSEMIQNYSDLDRLLKFYNLTDLSIEKHQCWFLEWYKKLVIFLGY